jgi:hypothetical protein
MLNLNCTLQAERVRDAAWGCDWVGAPVPFMRCLSFVIKMANKEIMLTAGKFVPVSKATMINVRYYLYFIEARCNAVVKTLRYKPEGRGIETR